MLLLRRDVAEALQHAIASGSMPSASERAEFAQAEQAKLEAANGIPRNYSVSGKTATIRVEGVLTPKPDLWAMFIGGANTSYESIRSGLALAESDPEVKDVLLDVHSPGGLVDGLFDTLAAIESFGKPISVSASMADSAAYALAAAAGPIHAKNQASEFGSIGVAVTVLSFPELIDITSTEAPNKRPDASTAEGKAVIREHLDAIHDLFADAIARGRTSATGAKVSKKEVNQNFGRGSVVLAKRALEQGMIDSIAKQPKNKRPGLRAADDHPEPVATKRAIKMDMNTLKVEHPELYKAVLEEGHKQGVAAERDRVEAHLTLGEASGDMKTAVEAIKTGDTMTAKTQAKYMAASMNRRDIEARQADSDAAAVVTAGAAAAPVAEQALDLGDQVVALLEADFPKKKSA